MRRIVGGATISTMDDALDTPDSITDTPTLPGSFKRFTQATDCCDQDVEFYEATGTYTGRNLAPPRRQGGPYQRNSYPVEGE